MIKKRVFIVSLVLVVIFLTRLYSNSTSRNLDGAADDVDRISIDSYLSIIDSVKNAEKKEEEKSRLTFADEEVPIHKASVKQKLNTYLERFSYKKQQSYRLHRNSEKHLPKIADILESYGIPEDFKYIPIVESGFDPRTTSHRGAGGYWQFMPATARLYGLKVNGSVDERLDLEKSTHAAAKYLKSLYKEFGDWTLVAAAYNVGGGSLKKSIRRQGTDSYYELKLNKETGSYVYKLISVKEVIEKPGDFGYRRLAKSNEVDDNEPNIL